MVAMVIADTLWNGTKCECNIFASARQIAFWYWKLSHFRSNTLLNTRVFGDCRCRQVHGKQASLSWPHGRPRHHHISRPPRPGLDRCCKIRGGIQRWLHGRTGSVQCAANLENTCVLRDGLELTVPGVCLLCSHSQRVRRGDERCLELEAF